MMMVRPTPGLFNEEGEPISSTAQWRLSRVKTVKGTTNNHIYIIYMVVVVVVNSQPGRMDDSVRFTMKDTANRENESDLRFL